MRSLRSTVIGAVASAALGLSGCQGSPFRLQVPQVQQASEAIESGGDRQRRYQSCGGSTASAAQVIPCMEGAGYEFIPRAPGYPAAECWSRREAKDDRLLGAFCFRKARADASEPPAAK